MISIPDFLNELISYVIVLPAMVLCYLPMSKQLLMSPWKLVLLILGVFSVTSTLCSYVTVLWHMDSSLLFYLVLVLFFLLYCSTLRANTSQSLCVFVSVCALMGYVSNFAQVMDSVFHPETTGSSVTISSSLYGLGLGVVLIGLLACVLIRFGGKLVNQFQTRKIWNCMTLLMAGFLIASISTQPLDFSYLRDGFLPYYCATQLVLLILQLSLFVFFYLTVMSMQALEAERRRVRLLRMQEKQFEDQQQYLAETSRMRHDFRHTILAIKSLADAGKTEELSEFVNQYVQDLPTNDVTNYCGSFCVNATLNFVAQACRQNKIRMYWNIQLPEPCPVADVDLCTILGNMLENGVRACKTLPEPDRQIHLTITTMDEPNLYIVQSNAFDGAVRMRGQRYLTTRPGGTGLGLESIHATAEKYNGTARFHHEGKIFCTDIRIPLEEKKPGEKG